MADVARPALVKTATAPATSQHCIAVTLDSNFLAYGLFVLNQIAQLHPDRDFDLAIVTTDELPEHPLITSLGVRVIRLDEGAVFQGVPHSERISMATYLRFYLARALAEYERILYLDSDLFIRRGDFSRLLRIEMGAHPVAGAREQTQLRHPKRAMHDMHPLGIKPCPYLQAGVQLIDTKQFNELEIGERALALAAEQPEKMTVYDQTAINAILKGGFAELPPVWNWLYGFRTLYLTELYDPAILHFAGRRKPWNTLKGEFPVRYSKVYRAFFNAHFPELSAKMAPVQPPSANRMAHLRYLLNHMNGLRRLVPALDAFDGDFDVRL